MAPPCEIGVGRIHIPMPEIGQNAPGKLLARILLARRRDVGMAEHPIGRDPVAGENAAAERGDRRDLSLRKIRVAVVVAGIGNLDADRAGVDVGFAGPRRSARMPGTALLGDHLDDVTVLDHHVVSGDFARRRAQQIDCRLRVAHSRVMQHDHVGLHTALALIVVRRRPDLRDHTRIRTQFGREHNHTGTRTFTSGRRTYAEPPDRRG